MFGFSLKGLVLVLLPLLPNLLFFMQPAPTAATNLKDGGLFVNILEHGGRIVFYILMESSRAAVLYLCDESGGSPRKTVQRSA